LPDCSSSPANGIPALAIDHNSTTKYLNVGELSWGVIITFRQVPVDVNDARIITANDAVGRDPVPTTSKSRKESQTDAKSRNLHPDPGRWSLIR
jgi:hypothetical protein